MTYQNLFLFLKHALASWSGELYSDETFEFGELVMQSDFQHLYFGVTTMCCWPTE